MNKIVLATFVLLASLIVGFFLFNSFIYYQKQASNILSSVTSYEDCVNAGYPILESYPQQCVTPDGRSFVQDISK